MTPFYTVLSIWVGALLMSSLLTTKVEDEENKYKPYQKYFGRGLLFMIISLLQTLIITLGDMYFTRNSGKFTIQICDICTADFIIILSNYIYNGMLIRKCW